MHPPARQRAPVGSESLHAAFQRHLQAHKDASQQQQQQQQELGRSVGNTQHAQRAHTVHLDAASLLPPYVANAELSQRLQEHALASAAEAAAAAASSASGITTTEPPLELAPGTYFYSSSSSSSSARRGSETLPLQLGESAGSASASVVGAPPFALGLPPARDASALFNPPAAAMSARHSILGHATDATYPSSVHRLPGSKLKSSYTADASISPAADDAGAAALAKEALSGMPLSFFGVSDLSRGQQKIQQRWMANLGGSGAPSVVPAQEQHNNQKSFGPLSPRKTAGSPRPSSAVRTGASKTKGRPSCAPAFSSLSSGEADDPPPVPVGPALIPSLNLPLQPWQPHLAMAAPKPAAHTHKNVTPHSFSFAQELPVDFAPNAAIGASLLHYPTNAAAPLLPQRSASSRRPASSTSRSQRAQQAVSAAAAAAAATARPSSAVPASSTFGARNGKPNSISRPGTASIASQQRLLGVAADGSLMRPAPSFRQGVPEGTDLASISLQGHSHSHAHIGNDGTEAGGETIPAAAGAGSLSSSSRPASAAARRVAAAAAAVAAGSESTPSNLYARYLSSSSAVAAAAEEEKHGDDADEDDDAGSSFSAEFQRWKAAQQREELTSAAMAHAAAEASAARSARRPASGLPRAPSRPGTARSIAGARSRPGSGTARHLIVSAAASAAANAGRLGKDSLLNHYLGASGVGSIPLVRVNERADAQQQWADRQAGRLLTTRARPPFEAMPGSHRANPDSVGASYADTSVIGINAGVASAALGTGHSDAAIASSALRPNAGFQTELRVSAHLLAEFQARAREEQVHFYSPALFWQYKLAEVLRATEPRGVGESVGADAPARGSNVVSATAAAAAQGGGAAAADDDGAGAGKDATNKTSAATTAALRIVPSSDHMYPNTFRLFASSFILQQLVPSLSGPSAAALAERDPHEPERQEVARELLRVALGVLHHSVFQEPRHALVPPPPPAHLLDPDLARGRAGFLGDTAGSAGTGPSSRRSRQLAAVEGSGYAQASRAIEAARQAQQAQARKEQEFDQALSDETRMTVAGVSSSILSNPMTASHAADMNDPSSSSGPAAAARTSVNNSVSNSVGGMPVPYALTVKYLYESVQTELTESEALSSRVARVDEQVGRILSRTNHRGMAMSFRAWRERVRMLRAKVGLGAMVSRVALAKNGRRDAKLIFHMWRQWSSRQKSRRGYKAQLRHMASQVRSLGAQLAGAHGGGGAHRDAAQLSEQMRLIASSLSALEVESSSASSAAPVDVFSPLALRMLLERFDVQLSWLGAEQSAAPNLLPLCSSYSSASSAPSTEVDMLLLEAGRLGSQDLLAVKQHLLSKLAAVRAREEEEENAQLRALSALPSQEFLFAWANAHLRSGSASSSISSQGQGGGGGGGGGGWVLEHVHQLWAPGANLYMHILRSVAPAVLDSVTKSHQARQQQQAGDSDDFDDDALARSGSSSRKRSGAAGAPATVSLSTPGLQTAAEADARSIQCARIVLEVVSQLGCLPVMTLEEFLAGSPAYGTFRARQAAEQQERIRRGRGTGVAASSSGVAQASADGAPLATLRLGGQSLPAASGDELLYSAHPADGDRHVFADLAASSEELAQASGANKKRKQQQLHAPTSPTRSPRSSRRGVGGRGALPVQRTAAQLLASMSASSRAAATGASSARDVTVAPNPHLHLCLLATLFLQRPSLPDPSLDASNAAAGSATASVALSGSSSPFASEHWVSDARSRVASMASGWEELRSRRENASLSDVQSFLAGVAHVGLEIDVLRARARRRADAFDQIRNKVEDLLWTLQKRKAVAMAAATAGGGAPGVDPHSTANGGDDLVRSSALSFGSSSTSSGAAVGQEEALYSEIPLGKLLDVLPSDSSASALREYRGLQSLLGRHYQDLSSIFRHYASLGFSSGSGGDSGANSAASAAEAASSNGTSMSFAELCVLCNDCHLLSSRSGLNKGVLHTLFTRCTLSLKQLASQSAHVMPHTDADRLEHSPLGGADLLAGAEAAARGRGVADKALALASVGGGGGNGSARDSHAPQLTLSQAGLFEALIRLSATRYSAASSLTERARRLLEMDVLPHARRLRLDEFRALLSRERVKHVFAAHRAELLAVFLHYAARDEDDDEGAYDDGDERDGNETAARRNKDSARHRGNGGGHVITQAGFFRLAQEAQLFTSAAAPAFLSSASSSVAFEAPQLLSLLSSVLRVPVSLLQAQASAAVGSRRGSTVTGAFAGAGHAPGAGASSSSVPGAGVTNSTTTTTTTTTESGLTFPEFLEALGAMAAFRSPDPYTPLQVKVESFVRGTLLPPLRSHSQTQPDQKCSRADDGDGTLFACQQHEAPMSLGLCCSNCCSE